MEIISRSKAQEMGLTHYFTGKPCKHGHDPQPRRVKDKQCPECNRIGCADWKAKNPDKKSAIDKAYRARKLAEDPAGYKEKERLRSAAWIAANFGYVRERNRLIAAKFRKEQPEKAREKYRSWLSDNREQAREASRRYAASNPHLAAASQSRRRASKKIARPDWLDSSALLEIKIIFKEAAQKTAESGVRHVVDHIVPLRGKTVCGLHVPWNMRVITEAENAAKGNRYWPDMP